MPEWSYGVTTCHSRRDNHLPVTLASLRAAGFAEPRLFVDGDHDMAWYEGRFGLPVSCRWPALSTPPGPAANWILSLHELYLRSPSADRYAVFQDDFVTVRNLRQYLDRRPCPPMGYMNLYTFPSNQDLVPHEDGKPVSGWFEARWSNGTQTGRGAVALVFPREAVVTLLSSRHMAERSQDCHRGHRSIDGGIVTAMNQAGWREYVHHPSLVQHTGLVSSFGNRPHPMAVSFPGEGFDALTLLD